MKRIANLTTLPLCFGLALGAVAVTAVPALAEDIDVSGFEYVDVIEKNDGSVLKGVIVEQEPGQKYKLATADGSLFVVAANDVTRLSKERNKNWRGAYGAPTGGGAAMGGGGQGMGGGMGVSARSGSSLPPPLATSGTRLDFELAAVFPRAEFAELGYDGYIDTSFAPTFRVGHEELFGNVGITGGGMGRFTYWMLDDDNGDALWTLETHAFVRTALHIGRVAPYAQLTVGLDTNYVYSDAGGDSTTDVGFGVNLGLGTQVAISDSMAVDIGADLHPGTDTLGNSDTSVSYFGLRLGIRNL